MVLPYWYAYAVMHTCVHVRDMSRLHVHVDCRKTYTKLLYESMNGIDTRYHLSYDTVLNKYT